MRFVAVKSEDQQAALMLHKTRDLLVRQRTMLINALRAHLGEYGIVKAQGPAGVNSLLALVQKAQDAVPVHAQSALRSIVAQFHALAKEIGHLASTGIATTKLASALRRCPASDRSQPQPSQQRYRMRRSSDQAASSRLG